MDCFIGTILPWSITWAPYGFHLCDGAMLTINQYQAVYSLIGATFGQTNNTVFGLPDLRGRVPLGATTVAANPNYVVGQTGGTLANTLAINASNLPLHNHGASFTPVLGQQTITIPAVGGTGSLSATVTGKVNSAAGTANLPSGNVYLSGLTAEDSNPGPCVVHGPYAASQGSTTANLQGLSATVTPTTDYRPASPASTSTITAVTGGAVSVAPGGGAAAPTPLVVDNRQPYQVINFLFCLQGIYPVRD